MQLFIITPFIIWIYLYKKILGLLAIFILSIVSFTYQIIIIMKYNIQAKSISQD